MIVEIVIAIAIAAIVGLYAAGFVFLRRLRNRAQDDLEELVGADNVLLVDRSANCGGHDDPDTVQLRGAGVLALTADALRFMLWMPRGRHLDVPLTAITATAETRTYRRAGYAKAALRPMLRVEFRTKTGAEASAVWTVTDAENWCEAIDEQRAQR
jgi:hypothetical protein